MPCSQPASSSSPAPPPAAARPRKRTDLDLIRARGVSGAATAGWFATAVIALLGAWRDATAESWAFTGNGNLGRVAFHAVAVVLQCLVLCYVTVRLSETIEREAAGAIERHDRMQAALAATTEAERRAADERRCHTAAGIDTMAADILGVALAAAETAQL